MRQAFSLRIFIQSETRAVPWASMNEPGGLDFTAFESSRPRFLTKRHCT